MSEEIFYLSWGLTLLTGFLAGYFLGFLRLGNRMINLGAAVAISFFTYTYLSGLFDGWGMQQEWAPVASFSIIFLAAFSLFFFLSRRFLRIPAENHRGLVNRISGGIGSVVITAVVMIVMLRATKAVDVPPGINLALEQSGINSFIDDQLGLSGKPEQPATGQIMARNKSADASHGFITLDFNTNEYTVRPDLEQQMLYWVNTERSKAGAGPLVMDSALTKLARAYSADMFNRGYFSHDSPEGLDPFQRMKKANIKYRYAGENLALAPTLGRAHDGLMKSPGHKANILQRSYHKIGIGVLESKKHGLMITQEFKD